MDKAGKIATQVSTIVLTLLLVSFLSILVAWPIQWLWNNCLVDAVDSVNPISFWQAFGINLLVQILLNKNTNSKNGKND